MINLNKWAFKQNNNDNGGRPYKRKKKDQAMCKYLPYFFVKDKELMI